MEGGGKQSVQFSGDVGGVNYGGGEGTDRGARPKKGHLLDAELGQTANRPGLETFGVTLGH